MFNEPMIPYLTEPQWAWLPVSFFSLLVFTGVALGIAWGSWQGSRYGFKRWEFVELGVWVVIPAYLGSHILLIVFYEPGKILTDPMALLRFNEGLSSFGGLLCAVIAFAIYHRVTGNTKNWRRRADLAMQAFIIGWIFGRLGCSFEHDHPGIHSDFFLAVQFPDGSRHDLGFYEFLFTLLILFPVSLLISRKKLYPGAQLVSFCVLYSIYRWPTDFLRILDTTYFGWTPAQFGCIVLIGVAVWLHRSRSQNHLPAGHT